MSINLEWNYTKNFQQISQEKASTAYGQIPPLILYNISIGGKQAAVFQN
ncbi:hypothetical protein DB42_DF00080 [Neochlamydia sp. EPS4]|nr:hypothetical protein DB42_DF00080 [Neochlamydia sp. EPS4]